MKELEPISPGEVLKEEFMLPFGLSASRLASELGVPSNRISDILRARRAITADTALRFERFFGMEAQFWLNLQTHYDLRIAKKQSGSQIRTQVRPLKKVA